jgi:hypothetical protein
VRRRLGLHASPLQATAADVGLFAAWALASLATLLASAALLLGPPALLVRLLLG